MCLSPSTVRTWLSVLLLLFTVVQVSRADTLELPAVITDKPVFLVDASSPPPGFEDLTGPQTTMVDVYFQNRFVLSTLVSYTMEKVEFAHPQELVAKLSRVTDPELVLKILSQPMDSHARLVCTRRNPSNCGELDPSVVGLIFDESFFRIDLFINPEYLQVSAVFDDRYLPQSSSKLSLLNDIDINTSGGEGQEDIYNIHSSTLLAYKQTRLRSELNYTENEQVEIDELSLQQDHKTWELEAGIFDTRGRLANFISQQDIIGLRVASSLKTRVDLDVAQGTPLYVFLNQRSRVEIFKDNRLIDARFYEAGNQQLDTSRFPEGSYTIDVRIQDQSGRERSEQFFFIKTTILPPEEEPGYFFEWGRIQEVTQTDLFADTTDAHLLRLGADYRLHNQVGFEVELDNTNDQSMLQGGLLWFMSNWRTQLNSMVTTESDWGVSIRNNLNFDKLSANLDFRLITEGDASNENTDFDFVRQSSTQATASITHPLFGGRASWLYRHIDSDQQEKSETYGVSYRKEIYSFNKLQADLTVNVNKDSDDYLVQTGIRFLWRNRDTQLRFNPVFETEKRDNQSQDDIIGSASASHVAEHEKIGRLRTTLFRNEEADSATNGLNFQSESQVGYHEIEFNQTHQNKQDTFSYLTNHRLNIATDFKHIALGGRRADLSALVIDIEGPEVDAAFNVYVDRQFVGTAYIGKSTIFGLRPYEEYEVRLESTGDDFVKFDESVRTITLYPGNVESLQYKVSRQLVIVGQVSLPNGTPLKSARIENISGFAGTDQDGWFQIETGVIENLLFNYNENERCTVSVPELNSQETLFVLESLVCHPLE